MAFKPNYNQQRAERNRAKQAKREEKLKQQQERTAKRRASPDGEPGEGEAGDLPETETDSGKS